MAHAIDFYGEALYWQASESVDWALTNNLSLPNQVISYKTIEFNFAPGFRIGAGLDKEDWSARLLYTHYNVGANDASEGNVISTFMLSKFAEKFYQTGKVHFKIHYQVVDVDVYKLIQVGESLKLNPIIGLKGGWVDQSVDSNFQGQITVAESVSNNFSGVGPKIGIDSQWSFYQKNDAQYNFFANISSAYMWGNWSINDSLIQSNSTQKSYLHLGKRNMGAFEVQGLLGVGLDYKNYSLKLGYEVADWFNQYQVFDNGSGTQTVDLILQGVSFIFHCSL